MALEKPTASELIDRVAERYFDDELADLARELAPQLEPYLGELPERSRATEIIGLGALLDNSGSMEEYEDVDDEEDGENEPLRLYEALVRDVNFMWSELTKSSYRRSIHVFNDLLHPNPDYTRKILKERDVFHWMPLLPSVPLLKPRGFIHGNGTPLYKRSFEFILAGVARAELLRLPPFNRKTRMNYLIMSDGESTEGFHRGYSGHQFTADDVAMLIEQLPEGHTAHFLGLGQESFFGRVGKSMGISPRNVRCVPREGKQIRAFLQLWSSSATDPTRLSDRDMEEFAIPVDSGNSPIAGGTAPELDSIFGSFRIQPTESERENAEAAVADTEVPSEAADETEATLAPESSSKLPEGGAETVTTEDEAASSKERFVETDIPAASDTSEESSTAEPPEWFGNLFSEGTESSEETEPSDDKKTDSDS